MSAAGYTCASTDHVPWSSPHSVSRRTGSGASRSATRAASAGSPGAGYRYACSAGGKPPKSWIVRGVAIAVTAVPRTYQCADTARIARGRGVRSPNARHASVCRLRSSVFIGLPWPRNTQGMRAFDPIIAVSSRAHGVTGLPSCFALRHSPLGRPGVLMCAARCPTRSRRRRPPSPACVRRSGRSMHAGRRGSGGGTGRPARSSPRLRRTSAS